PHLKDASGTPYPSYRCLFPEAPAPATVLNCSEVGVLGASVGVVGTLQAVEVVKEILSIGDSLVGRLMLYDALSARFSEMKYGWDPSNPHSGPDAG
ncbi:MAG TPA: adenylyltransferase, partial [Pseudomonadota bacterium]|nr:adenylyltransferase [Pseudomonadota bacterium]